MVTSYHLQEELIGVYEGATATAPNFISPLLSPTLQPSPHSPPIFTQLAYTPTRQRRPNSPPLYTQLARPPRAPKDDFSRHRQPSVNYTNSFLVNPEPQDSPTIQYTKVTDSGRYSQNSTATVFTNLTSSLPPEVGETLLPELPPVVIFDESAPQQPDMYRRFDSSPPPYGIEDETRQKKRRRKKKKKREQKKDM
jgi:hypothetical protein